MLSETTYKMKRWSSYAYKKLRWRILIRFSASHCGEDLRWNGVSRSLVDIQEGYCVYGARIILFFRNSLNKQVFWA